MKIKKIISFFLACCLIFCAGCSKQNENSNTNTELTNNEKSNLSNFDILYCTRDTFDPYSCKTKQNFELSYLLFDPLVKLDNDYNLNYCLAKEVSLKDAVCTITLKEAYFTDGTKVTVDDIVFSFNKAKNSSTIFAYSLKNAVSIQKADDKTAIIKLTKKDPYFMYVLDFPILKKDSDNLKNSDNKSLPPIGSGRYLFNEDYSALIANNKYHGVISNIINIGLVDSPDTESDYHNIEIGLIDYYYSNLQDGEFPKMNGIKVDVNLNNLVFLGINHNNKYLSNVHFRQALSSAIDRNSIAEKSYYTNAKSSKGPFPAFFAPARDYQTITSSANNEVAITNLQKLGITKKNQKGNYLYNEKEVSLKLLVNMDNSIRTQAAEKIAEQLNSFGFTVQVEKVSRSVYDSRIKSKNYDLYLGEMRLSNNMDLTELISFISSTGYTANKSIVETSSTTSSTPQEVRQEITTANAVNKFYNGEYTLGDVLSVFNSELPIIPIVHRTGLCIYSNNIKYNFIPSNSDLFFGIENIK